MNWYDNIIGLGVDEADLRLGGASDKACLFGTDGLSADEVRSPLQSHEFNFFGHDHTQSMSYAELVERSDRFAEILTQLGAGKGDKLALMLGRQPALYVCKMGSHKSGLVASPLHPAFGVDEVLERLNQDKVAVLVTTVSQYWRKIAVIRDQLPYLKHVFVVSTEEGVPTNIPDTLDYYQLMA